MSKYFMVCSAILSVLAVILSVAAVILSETKNLVDVLLCST